jgi:hypothetical protein
MQGHKAEVKDGGCNSSNPFSTLSEAISEHKSSQECQDRSRSVRTDGKVAISGSSCTSPPPPATSACKRGARNASSLMQIAAQIHNRGEGGTNVVAAVAVSGRAADD